MGPNELLYWLSARQDGTWAQFRSAIEEIFEVDTENEEGPPFHQRVRFALEQLGHVEFTSNTDVGGWRVSPPVLAVSEQQGRFLAVVCGARSPQIVKSIENVCKSTSDVPPSNVHPSVIRVFAPDLRSLSETASQVGLLLQIHAPLAILSCVPRVDRLTSNTGLKLPFGRDLKVSHFVVGRHTCRWVPSTVDDAARGIEGLFKFVRFQMPEYYLNYAGRAYKIDGQTGKFFVLAQRHQQVLKYDRLTHSLILPGICRPPLLVDRALVICSGFLPTYEPAQRILSYGEIDEGVANCVASLLCQKNL